MAGEALERLRQALPLSPGSAEGAEMDLRQVAAAEAALGVRLPPDYLDLLAVYGAGTLDGFPLIAAPETTPGLRYSTSIVELTGTFRRAAAKPYVAEVVGDGESYIRWGVDDDLSYLWRIERESSAEWPVCLYGGGELTALPYGAVEFLARACTSALPEALQRRYGRGGHEFLTWQEQYRRDSERYGFSSCVGG